MGGYQQRRDQGQYSGNFMPSNNGMAGSSNNSMQRHLNPFNQNDYKNTVVSYPISPISNQAPPNTYRRVSDEGGMKRKASMSGNEMPSKRASLYGMSNQGNSPRNVGRSMQRFNEQGNSFQQERPQGARMRSDQGGFNRMDDMMFDDYDDDNGFDQGYNDQGLEPFHDIYDDRDQAAPMPRFHRNVNMSRSPNPAPLMRNSMMMNRSRNRNPPLLMDDYDFYDSPPVQRRKAPQRPLNIPPQRAMPPQQAMPRKVTEEHFIMLNC